MLAPQVSCKELKVLPLIDQEAVLEESVKVSPLCVFFLSLIFEHFDLALKVDNQLLLALNSGFDLFKLCKLHPSLMLVEVVVVFVELFFQDTQ